MADKQHIRAKVETLLQKWGFRIAGSDFDRPWGGFFVIDEQDAKQFVDRFFPDEAQQIAAAGLQISPKILVVAPMLRLSWQYHDRRSELHYVIEGPVAYALSATDVQPEPDTYEAGALIRIPQGTRHRLIGRSGWGIVAEVWQHTDPGHPSKEEDNHRLQDDFKRT